MIPFFAGGKGRCGRAIMVSLMMVAVMVSAGCSTVPATGSDAFIPLSVEQEATLGQEQHPRVLQAFGGAYDDPELQRYVDSVGQLLASTSELANRKWTFTILNSDVVNAFALPGGYVYVTRALLALAEDEAELAAVVGHEIGHVTARHAAQRQGQNILAGVGAVAAGVLLGGEAANVAAGLGQAHVASYSREQENEADTLGIRYMSRAGHDPEAMSTFLRKLEAQKQLLARITRQTAGTESSYLSTHPPTIERVHKSTAEARATKVVQPMRGRDVFLDKIDGMIYGDDPTQGLVKGRVFAHPKLGFRFEVPPGFAIVNQPDKVVAIGSDGARLIFDYAREASSRPMVDYVAGLFGRDRPLGNIQAIRIDGMEAATGYARASTRAGRVDVRAVAIRWDPQTVYRFVFVTPSRLTDDLSTELRRTTYSFRRLREGEAQRLRPYRIRIETVRRGDTIEDLAARLPFETFRVERFLVLNGLRPGEALEPGTRIKTVSE